MKNKRLLSLLMSIIMLFGMVSVMSAANASESQSIKVYFTLSIYGDFATDKNGNAIALSPIELTGKQSYTMDDVFQKTHEIYYDGNNGYDTTAPSGGSPYITKLWGDTSGYFGYQVNAGSEPVLGLNHEIEDGDYIDAAIYKNAYPATENYTYFDKYSAVTAVGKEVTLTLYESGYDSFFSPYVTSCGGAEIYVNGSTANIVTTSDGRATLIFDTKGEYIVSAKKTKQLGADTVPAITAPVCKVTVKDAVDVMHGIAKKYATPSLVNDGNLPWFVADLVSYEDAFEDSEYKLNAEAKKACLDKLIDKADTATTPNDLAKYIIGIRALGYDAKNVTTKDLRNIDVTAKLTTLVDSEDTRVANTYTLPYVIIALQQGTGYATQAQINYLLDLAITNKSSWTSPAWGMTDNISPVILALAPYYNTNDDIKDAIDEALAALVDAQGSTGAQSGYGGTPSSSSTGLAIAAFSAMGIDAEDVTKGGKSLIDGLMYTVNSSFDGFNPTSNTIGTEQGMRGLAAWQLFKNSTEKRVFDFASKPMNPAVATPEQSVDSGSAPSDGTPALPNPGTNNNISVNIKVMVHSGENCNNSYTYKYNSANYTALVNENLTLQKGDTVYDALEKALNEKHISFIEGSPGYISSINGLAEMAHGNNSGWMFTVNGSHVNEGCREKTLTSSCNIIWFYTDNYTNEKGSSYFSSGGGSFGSKSANIEDVIDDTALYLYETSQNPTMGSTGGEWLILGLSRSGAQVPDEYYQKYYENIESYVKENKGILHDIKYTEYARVALAVTALGKSAENVGGYNIIAPLADYSKVISQGINSPIWALIALDSGKYQLPQNNDAEIQATREMYVDYILSLEKENGGWSLAENSDAADADITAMALVALSNYNENEKVNEAIERALTVLSKMQNKNGSFLAGSEENAESTAQVLTALSTLGISYKDSRFTKNKNTTVTSLLSFYKHGKGFMRNGKTNRMTTEQCLYALVAAQRLENKKNSLFDMSDAIDIGEAENKYGLLGKAEDVKFLPAMYIGKTFEDIENHEVKEMIEILASKGIINGISEREFAPERTMTRAGFAAIIVRGLGLENKGGKIFDDVQETDWYFDYVNTAFSYGIVKGESEKIFNPEGTITKEEAATMTARAAALCGLDTQINDDFARDILAAFTDYIHVSNWAKGSLAFCYNAKILDDSGTETEYSREITRAEMAQLLYKMLNKAELI